VENSWIVGIPRLLLVRLSARDDRLLAGSVETDASVCPATEFAGVTSIGGVPAGEGVASLVVLFVVKDAAAVW